MAPAVRVLVVDDDFRVASIHTRFVQRIPGFEVVGTATTGHAALSEVARLSPDLVLLDVYLPDLSGIEVLRTLRGNGNDVGVVMLTAAREVDTVRAAAAGGAAHYLVKPFDFDDLRVRLEAWRDAREALTSTRTGVDDTVDQRDIDAVFTPVLAGPARSLPKGLSAPTADAVLEALRAAGELSAAECAEAVGLSRVSARRYLEHFAETGRAVVRLRYGGAGRPERRYRPRD